eukprot:1390636-Amphidinium_carterae.1
MQLHCRGELYIPDGRTCARAKYGHLHGCTSARVDELQKYLGLSLPTQATKGDEADTAKQIVELVAMWDFAKSNCCGGGNGSTLTSSLSTTVAICGHTS